MIAAGRIHTFETTMTRALRACVVLIASPVIAILCVASSTVAADPTTKPAAAAVGKYEQDVIERTPTIPTVGRSASATTQKAADYSLGLDTTRVIIALAAVVGLIVLLRFFGQRFLGLPTAKATGAVRVLSRTPISPRQQVLLLQVGKRVLIVSENNTALAPLGEITDVDEINSLVGQLTEQRNAGAAAGAFGSVFSRARRDFDEPGESTEPVSETPKPADPSMDETRSELSGLLDKVRAVSRQMADR